MTTASSVLDWINTQSGRVNNVTELAQFKAELTTRLGAISVHVPGAPSNSTTLLYSGDLGSAGALGNSRIQSWQVAEAVGAQSESKGQVSILLL
jgi:hypothetical protein